MKANHVLRSVPRLLLPLLVALAYVPVARSQALPSQPFPYSSSGGVTTFSAGTATAANAAAFTFAPAANGGVYATASPSVPTTTGKAIPVTATARIPPAALGAALARFSFKLLPIASTGMAIADLWQELGVSRQDLNGSPVLTYGTNPGTYNWQDGAGRIFATPDAAGAFYVQYFTNVEPRMQPVTYRLQLLTSDENGPKSYFIRTCEGPDCVGGGGVFGLNRYQLTQPGSAAQISEPQLADLIASKSGWPIASAVGRALKQAAQDDVPVPLEVPQITGPVDLPPDYLPQPVVTTTRRPLSTTTNPGERVEEFEETRTTTTPKIRLRYDDATVTEVPESVTNKETRIVTVRTPLDANGNPSGSPTTVPAPWAPGETSTTTNPPQPADDLCAKNPEALACAKLGEVPDAQLPTRDMSVSFSPLPFQSNASCPDPASFQLVNLGEASGSYSLSFAPLCSAATTYVRPLVLLISAALAAFIFVGGLKT